MVSSPATTVSAYLKALPPERRAALQKVRSVILENLAPGFEEGMQYGMIGYYIPLRRYPVTYNGQALAIAALAAQKQYLVVYLMSVYGDPATRRWFEKAYRDSGKKLDMGKSCVRFKTLDDLPVELVGEAIRRVTVEGYIDYYEKHRGAPRAKTARTTAKKTTKKTTKTTAGKNGKPDARPAAKKTTKPTTSTRARSGARR
jgi:hypothetical protein